MRLTEITVDKNILGILRMECSDVLPIYKQARKTLLRGMKKTIEPYKISSPVNRPPTFTAYAAQEFIDEGLRVAGFKALRSNSILTTSDPDLAIMFGPVSAIFPCNGFDFTWSRTAQDFGAWYGILRAEIRTELKSTMYDKVDDLVYERLVQKGFKSLDKQLEFDNINFFDAIMSGHEVMIHGNCYVVPRKLSDQLFDE